MRIARTACHGLGRALGSQLADNEHEAFITYRPVKMGIILVDK